LELGFDDVTPNNKKDISSWLYDYAADKVSIVDNRAKAVACYDPGYTFVEKLQTVSTKFRQQQASKEFPINFMQHYYDIYGLLQRPDVQAFIGTADGRSEFWWNEMALSNTAQPQVPAKAAAQCHGDPLWQEGCARLKWMVSAGMRASILMVVGLAVGGCAQLGRLAAVSAEETGRATVLEIPDARFLPSDGTAIGVLAQRLYEREVRYFASVGRPVPPEYILAVSGGGDNGAFSAGLLVGWSESGMRPRFKVVTGISTGALIAPFALLGSDFDAILREIYTTIEQKDIFERRPLLAGLASDALADSAPLEKLISKYLDERIVARLGSEYRQGRALIVITTNLDAGVPVIWNIGAIAESGRPEAAELIRKILLASASIPALFPPVMFNVQVNGVQH
jgi:hypothetical protein